MILALGKCTIDCERSWVQFPVEPSFFPYFSPFFLSVHSPVLSIVSGAYVCFSYSREEYVLQDREMRGDRAIQLTKEVWDGPHQHIVLALGRRLILRLMTL